MYSPTTIPAAIVGSIGLKMPSVGGVLGGGQQWPKRWDIAVGGGDIASGDHDYDEGHGLCQMSTSVRGIDLDSQLNRRRLACARRRSKSWLRQWNPTEKSVIAGSNCCNAGIGGGSWSMACNVIVTIVQDLCLEEGWRLASGKPKWRRS